MSAGCTCPSGDGSLRWPCPVHPAADERRSQPVDSVALNLEAQLRAVAKERDDLRAALAAKGQQEPVAWMVLARANGHVLGMYTTEKDAAVTARWADIAEVRPLYAAPVAQQSEAGAQDAARYRFLREHWVSFSAAPPLSNLHWKGDKLDAKVDAAILEGGAHG